MTDNDVIKALECCSRMVKNSDEELCRNCPLHNTKCLTYLPQTALDLIKRQKADVELYRERANKYEAQVAVLLEQTRKQRDEINKLKIVAEPYLDEIARECGLNGSKSTGLEKVEHNSLCETETYKGDADNG